MKEVVIKISDDIYEWVRDNILFTSNTEGEDFLRTKHELTGAIAYGKVLPKEHGELITKGQAVALIQFYQQNPQHFSFENLIDDIDKEMPVIEGDTE